MQGLRSAEADSCPTSPSRPGGPGSESAYPGIITLVGGHPAERGQERSGAGGAVAVKSYYSLGQRGKAEQILGSEHRTVG
jgi:hypothetical protein